ncbi:MAG: hypothetical protein LBD15_00330 [Holosporales bacterium]|jgi:F-type H+-transporting ATPase subunit epsilon|nr:hypothetical protein [Holosporales bacterium]
MSDADTFKVTVLAPEGILWIGQAEMLVAPGALGQFTILPRHIPMISLLEAGSVLVHEKKTGVPPQAFDITHGVCSVLPTEVVVLGHLRG